jgi:hypothetical protein
MFFNKTLSAAEVLAQYQLVSDLPGDYNRNGTVDAADYSVWRDTLGQTGLGLAADGNNNQQVDADDYVFWKNNFGTAQAGAAASSQSVPEPAITALCGSTALSLTLLRRRTCVERLLVRRCGCGRKGKSR